MNHWISLTLLTLLSITLCIEPEETINELGDFFAYVEQIKISEEDSIKTIESLIQILQRYVFSDILKNPPQPLENYLNIVYLEDDLKKIDTNERSLYNFYRDVKKVISACQDPHLNFKVNTYFGELSLSNSFFISPISLYIDRIDRKVYAKSSSYENSFDADIIKIINENVNNPIKTINGLDPLDYILQLNGHFNKYKSPQAQFVYNMKQMNGIISILSSPFSYEDLVNIPLEYYNNEIKVEISYKVLTIENSQLSYHNLRGYNSFSLPLPNTILLKSSLNQIVDGNWDKVIKNGKNQAFACKVYIIL